MSMQTVDHPLKGQQEINCNFQVPKVAYITASNAAVGGICSIFVYVINPLAGAIFGAVHSLMHTLLQPGFKELLKADDTLISKIYIFAASFFTSAAIATAMATAVGFSMPILASLTLAALMIPASIAIDFIIKAAIKKDEGPKLPT